jgi:hypothetical protein
MAKEKKTADELASLVADKIDIGWTVKIYADPVHGWKSASHHYTGAGAEF